MMMTVTNECFVLLYCHGCQGQHQWIGDGTIVFRKGYPKIRNNAGDWETFLAFFFLKMGYKHSIQRIQKYWEGSIDTSST